MLAIASQIIICLIIAALIGGIIGYLIGRGSCREKSDCHSKDESTHDLHIDHHHKDTASETSLVDPLSSSEEALHLTTATIDTDNSETVEGDVVAEAVGVQPLLLTEPREGGKDNLQLIKGVGKVLEGVLNETGIYHFDQIANLSDDEAAWLDNSVAFPGRIKREHWIEQAKLLASGETTEFSQRVEKGEVATSKKSTD
jgi:predicted flap endonuclease-1-like 5' DNA nuclease